MKNLLLLIFALILNHKHKKNIPSQNQPLIINIPEAKTDLFKRAVDIITLVIITIGLVAAIYQSVQLKNSIDLNSKTINMSLFTTIATQTTDVDKVMIENSTLKKFFYDGVDIRESDREYEKAFLISILMLDYFDNVAGVTHYLEPGLSKELVSREIWIGYVSSMFRSSPILCKVYKEKQEYYGGALWNVVPDECKKFTHDSESEEPLQKGFYTPQNPESR